MSEIYNPLQEFITKRDLRRKAAEAERDRKIAEIESMGGTVNIYDAGLMSELFGPKNIDDINRMS